MSEMLTFQGFDNGEMADSVAQTLRSHGITVVVEQNPALLDSNFIGQDFGNNILVKLWPADFERAQKILIDSTVIDMNEVDHNYMLFQMTDKELEDVLAAPEEWGAWNYKLAMQILAERGIAVTDQKTETLKETHINTLSEQKKLTSGWLITGYGFSILAITTAILVHPVFALFLFSFSLLPGILGVVLGIIIIRSKKTLPDGSQVASYDKNARMHGTYMILLCVLTIIIVIFLLGMSS